MIEKTLVAPKPFIIDLETIDDTWDLARLGKLLESIADTLERGGWDKVKVTVPEKNKLLIEVEEEKEKDE